MHLLKELKDEHESILAMLQHVIDLGIISDEAQALLRTAKALLLTHLKKENDQFYPPLRRAAMMDKELEKVLQAYGRDMEAVHGTAVLFFAKYNSGGSDKEFARELGKLYGALKERIHGEERTLFPEYEKRVAGKNRSR